MAARPLPNRAPSDGGIPGLLHPSRCFSWRCATQGARRLIRRRETRLSHAATAAAARPGEGASRGPLFYPWTSHQCGASPSASGKSGRHEAQTTVCPARTIPIRAGSHEPSFRGYLFRVLHLHQVLLEPACTRPLTRSLRENLCDSRWPWLLQRGNRHRVVQWLAMI